MKWTLIARDADDDPRQWCGHWHDNADDAIECTWSPEDPDWQVCVIEDYRFDPILECVHELHPAECLRCLALECIHLNDPDQCERCHRVSQLENADASVNAEAQEGPTGLEGPTGQAESGSDGPSSVQGET